MRHSSTLSATALLERWGPLCASGEVGIALYRAGSLVGGRHEHTSHYAASTVKLAILIAALAEGAAGRLDLGRPVRVVDEFPRHAGGAFVLDVADDQDDATWEKRGTMIPLDILLTRMIVESSNIATNLVLTQLGFEPVRRTIARAGSGGVSLVHYIGDAEARRRGGNQTTAEALGRLLALLSTGRLLSPSATERALTLLSLQKHRTRIAAGLPHGVWVAGKPGWTDAVEHDVALIRPPARREYVLAVCTTGAGPDAAELVARISAETWAEVISWRE